MVSGYTRCNRGKPKKCLSILKEYILCEEEYTLDSPPFVYVVVSENLE